MFLINYKCLMLLCCAIFSLSSFANQIAVSGENISADKINSSIFQIGDVKQSILSTVQFQSINGDCWVQMEGQSISGSDLANIGIANLPDARGRFLRTHGIETVAVGQTQEDAFQGHRHESSVPGSSTALGSSIATFTRASSNATSGVQVLNPTTDTVNGLPRTANETRPKNLVLNTFIKINKNCNFN